MKKQTVFGVLLSLFLASCAVFELPPPDRDPDVRALRRAEPAPMPFAVAVAPLEIDLEAECPPGVENFAISKDMAAILETTGIFGAVRAVSLLENGEVALPPDADILLRLRAHRLEVEFAGRNAYFWPNLLLWAGFVFPAWWVPDETFQAKVDLEVVAVSTRSGNLLGAHTASTIVRRDLNDFQRGWFPLGILLAPSAFSSKNWECAAREVLLPALRRAEVDLARWLDTVFRERFNAGEIHAKTATTFALCVGAAKYESLSLHNLKKPRSEARALARFLSDPKLGGVRPSRVRTLLDDRVTRPGLIDALEEILVEAPRAEDTVLVYLSGYGGVFRTEKGPVHAFLTYESEPGKPDTPKLALKDLADVVARANAGRIVVVIDAGFAGGLSARAAGPPPLFEKELHALCSEMVVRGRGFVVLVERFGAGEEGDFLKDFTAVLAGKGDLDASGSITGAELKEVFSKTPPGAGYTARVFGEALDKIIIPFGKGKVKK